MQRRSSNDEPTRRDEEHPSKRQGGDDVPQLRPEDPEKTHRPDKNDEEEHRDRRGS